MYEFTETSCKADINAAITIARTFWDCVWDTPTATRAQWEVWVCETTNGYEFRAFPADGSDYGGIYQLGEFNFAELRRAGRDNRLATDFSLEIVAWCAMFVAGRL